MLARDFQILGRLYRARLLRETLRSTMLTTTGVSTSSFLHLLATFLLTILSFWIFQANAAYFDLPRALRSLPTITWIVTRYRASMSEGDHVALWLSGARAGIYGFGTLESFLTASSARANATFWLDKTDKTFVGKQHAVIRIDVEICSSPLLKSVIRNCPALSRLSILNAPMGTNFKVTPDEWNALLNLHEPVDVQSMPLA
jgi:hypothetical protein